MPKWIWPSPFQVSMTNGNSDKGNTSAQAHPSKKCRQRLLDYDSTKLKQNSRME